MSASTKMSRAFLGTQVLAHFCRLSSKSVRYRSSYSTVISTGNIDNEETVSYPDIKPRWPPGKDWSKSGFTEKISWRLHEAAEEARQIPELKKRLEHLAGTKDGWLSSISPLSTVPGTLEYTQFVTRTHIEKGLPDVCTSSPLDRIDHKIDTLKSVVQDVILQETEYHDQQHLMIGKKHGIHPSNKPRWHRGDRLVSQIASAILSCVAIDNEQLMKAQVDRNVRIETFWKCSGFGGEKMGTKGAWLGVLTLQYADQANMQLRTELPLPEFVSSENDMCTKGQYPDSVCTPQIMKQKPLFSRPITMSGHWVGDPCEFVQSAYHVMPPLYEYFLNEYGHQYSAVAELQYGLATSFASCVAQAHNQGFTHFDDVTYPITTQSVLTTDGSWLQFFAYQLNTMHMWMPREANPLNNVLWHTDKVQLFDRVENGEVKGFNDEAFKMLLRMILLKPVDRGVDLRPYLPQEEAPVHKHNFINHVGEEVPEYKPAYERFELPRNAVYF